MKLALMQPYFLPYIGYFQLIHAVDKYVFFGYLNFGKNEWSHRNRYIIKNVGPAFFTLRLLSRSQYKRFNEIYLDPSLYWRNKLIKSIVLNYSKSPYFEETIDLIHSIIFSDIEILDQFNANSIISICKHLDINTKIQQYPLAYLEIEKKLTETCNNLKSNSMPINKQTLDKKTKRVLEICKYEKADVYINPIGGKNLYNKQVFAEYGIDLFFIKTQSIEYKQQWNKFEPNLSIIDVLMNCGKENTKAFLKEYDLV
jgi:hypothetical protein